MTICICMPTFSSTSFRWAIQLGKIVALGGQFAVLQPRQGAQAHLDDGRSLDVAQLETLDHGLLGQVGGLRRTDDVHDLVDVVLCDQETQHDM